MKKLIKSKGFIVTVLSLACVAVLAVCFFFGRDRAETFYPDAAVRDGEVTDWTEPSGSPETEGTGAEAYDPLKTPVRSESYPQTTEESETETVVDFIPPAEQIVAEPPDQPEASGDNTDPDAVPSYAPEDLESDQGEQGQSTEEGNDNTPEAGDVNENGEYYVPGFGWVLPSTSEQIEMDNDGDPNKMVGDM